MTPSGITIGQIGKIQELLGAGLRKSGLPSEPTQMIIEQQGEAFVTEFIAAFRKRVEAVDNIAVRHVFVNRSRMACEALGATGQRQFVNSDVAKKMPRAENDKADVIFFKLGRSISDSDLEREYELRGLMPADPYSLAAVNEADPAFANGHPNSTHWKNADDNWCYAAFSRWDDELDVDVNRDDGDWGDYWWFAGLRK
ncbi:MAG: hypothetical protein NTU85_00350 [Candidatus Kaiserbacteria bacterium]|nr:hypothetical protein [Candidatus Kaiserbacteria bacterium]